MAKKKTNQDIDFKQLGPQLKAAAVKAGRFKALLFFIALAALYGFILYRINVYTSEGPSDSDVSSASQGVAHPRIDPATVDKIKELKDNSVNVQSLFGNRQNPFSE